MRVSAKWRGFARVADSRTSSRFAWPCDLGATRGWRYSFVVRRRCARCSIRKRRSSVLESHLDRVGLLFPGDFAEEGCRDSHLVRAAGDGVGDDVPAVTADGECVSGGDRSIREA